MVVETRKENALDRFVTKTRELFAREPELDARWTALTPILARLLAELRDDETADESLTGFPDDEITRLLESLEDESSPVAVPCEEIDYRVMINCVDGEHQLELLEWLAREGLTCRALV